MTRFILYSRSYCHLCEDMLEQLQAWSDKYQFSVEVIDVDADETLVALYDELVPVLFGSKAESEAKQLCHYFLDTPTLQRFFDE